MLNHKKNIFGIKYYDRTFELKAESHELAEQWIQQLKLRQERIKTEQKEDDNSDTNRTRKTKNINENTLNNIQIENECKTRIIQ